MYHHVEKVLYIKVEVERITFNRTLYKEAGEIEFPKNNEWDTIINRNNQFIRFLNNGSYIDLKIKKISADKNYKVSYSGIIDYAIQRIHTYINKKTFETCQAKTIQEAADLLKVNLRHVKKIK